MPKSSKRHAVKESAVPCCEIGTENCCTGRLFTDWRPDYQKYMCNRCVELIPTPLSRMLAIRQRAQQRKEAARGGEFVGVEDDADFWPSNVGHGQ
jgi:hypothetical protein